MIETDNVTNDVTDNMNANETSIDQTPTAARNPLVSAPAISTVRRRRRRRRHPYHHHHYHHHHLPSILLLLILLLIVIVISTSNSNSNCIDFMQVARLRLLRSTSTVELVRDFREGALRAVPALVLVPVPVVVTVVAVVVAAVVVASTL